MRKYGPKVGAFFILFYLFENDKNLGTLRSTKKKVTRYRTRIKKLIYVYRNIMQIGEHIYIYIYIYIYIKK